MRTILHSDMNSCYAGIEHLYHPELAGKLFTVGGDPEAWHGIDLAKDQMAKKVGVKTGMLGVTGSGKTFTMANVIKALQKPTLVTSHSYRTCHRQLLSHAMANKTLAAQ